MVMSEFDQNCTFLVHRSHHHYMPHPQSMAASLVSSASVGLVDGANVNPDAIAAAAYMPQHPQLNDLQKRLENTKDTVKLQALKEVILWVMQPTTADNGVSGVGSGGNALSSNVASRLLMTIIRFVLPSTSHEVKKMLQLYWEIVDKTKSDGSLKEEMILVCNKLREDLLHPNEYVRGSTLRLLCKIKFIKILEPLIEAIVQNLNHSHAYVRRNAIMCIYSMVRSFGTDILPHAAEEIQRLLLVESDVSTKRNAFLMLINCDLERAVSYALSVQDKVTCLGDIFQLAVLELLRRVSRENPTQTGNLLRIIVTLLDSCCSPAVAYEGGSSLLALTSSPVALKAATRAYISLLTRQADNNVKLIVLDRLKEILDRHRGALEEFVIDILRAVSSPSFAVRKKALGIVLQLITKRTVGDVVTMLKKELVKTLATETIQQCDQLVHTAYQQLLIRSMRTACKGHLDVIQPILNLLLDFLTDRNIITSTEVAMFVRELVCLYPDIRSTLLPKICEAIPEISHSRVTRVCMWMIGEFCEDTNQRHDALNVLFQSLSPMPFPEELNPITTGGRDVILRSNGLANDSINDTDSRLPIAGERKVKVTTRTVVLPDGTYGTEDIYEDIEESLPAQQAIIVTKEDTHTVSKLRSLITSGDFLLAAIVSITTAKLVLKPIEILDMEPLLEQSDYAKSLLIVASLLKFCSSHPCCGEKGDATIRINQACRLLTGYNEHGLKQCGANPFNIWFENNRDALREVIHVEKEAALYESTDVSEPVHFKTIEHTYEAPDHLIRFRQLGIEEDHVSSTGGILNDSEADLQLALGIKTHTEDTSIFQQRLARVQQMTGLADPIYVEAFLQVNQFDFIVELLIINRTQETLQNVNVELSTHGDLKLVERPPTVTLCAGQSHTLHASIRVQSTETGIIFGHITFDKSTSVDKEFLVLNELHVDLLDFIQRSWIGELSFRSMWAEFEWENKITISTAMTDVSLFVEHVMRQTNMTIVGKYIDTSHDHSTKSVKKPMSSRHTPWTSTNGETHIIQSSGEEGGGQDYVSKVKELPVLQRLMNNSAFFAVNLYSRSIFGEDALANVSVEKLPNGKLAGNIRIRSRSQGIALSLGDRITVVQRGLNK